MDFILTLGLIGLFIYCIHLQSRINALEEGRSSAPAPASSAPAADADGSQEEALAALDAAEQVRDTNRGGPTAPEQFLSWLSENWILKLGVLLVIIGVGWFVSYAFLNDWIGPVGRITIGLIAGVGVLVFASYWVKRSLAQGGALLVLGAMTILMTIFAAREVYEFFTPLTALIVMFLTVAYVTYQSVVYDRFALALASLIMAGLVPLFTAAEEPDFFGLCAYLMVVALATLSLTAVRGWRWLVPVSLLLTIAYTFIAPDEQDGLLAALVFSAVYVIFSVLYFHRHALVSAVKTYVPDLLSVAGVTLYLLIWVIAGAPEQWQSLILAAWMLVYGVAGYSVFRLTQLPAPFYLYTAGSAVLLLAATAVELEGAALTMALTLEAGAMTALALYARERRGVVAAALAVFLPVLLFSLESMSVTTWRERVFHEDFFVLLVLMIVFGVLARFVHTVVEGYEHVFQKWLVHAFSTLSGAYAAILVWLSLHASLANDLATTLSLGIYTIVGLMFYGVGHAKDQHSLRITGAIILGLVGARLLLIDVWELALFERIIAFIGIGLLFISTAFIERRTRNE
jgi:uncharacterized membrane protein